MLLLLLSSAAAVPPPAPKPIDRESWVTASDYPKSAIRQGVEGAVAFRLDVDAKGRVTACQVTEPSGQPTLDQPTCDLMMQRSHFTPAADDSGKPVASTFSSRVRWKLPVPVAPPSAEAERTVQAAIASLRFKPRLAFRLPTQPQFEKTPDPVEDAAAAAPPADPRVLFGQLPNGLRYAILANNTPRGAVSFRFRVAVGSQDEAPGQGGYAHLIEHLMFRGSTNVPDGEFERSLEQMGLAMGSDTTAFTFPETTLYGLDFPPSPQSTSTTGLFLLREVADRGLIMPGPLTAEKGVVLSEKRVRDTAALRMDMARLDFIKMDAGAALRDSVVKHLVGYANRLKIPLIFSNVGDEAQFNALQQFDVHFVQGPVFDAHPAFHGR